MAAKRPAISVIGLGKLGAPLAAVLADRGFAVIGADRDEGRVQALRMGRAPVIEPGLQERIAAAGAALDASVDTREAVRRTAITFVLVPTPSDADGTFTNRFVVEAVDEIGAGLREKRDYHLVVVTSTVMPGSTGGVIREQLEKASGRRVGSDVGLCYSPEFIALGSVIPDLLHPDFVLIGESDARAGKLLADVYERVCENAPPIHRMGFVDAELTKLAVNTFVTTKISYANMLADLCDRLPGADVDVVTRALAADRRIGGRYLRGSVAYGGPCFPRDNKAFAALGRRLGARCDLAEATDRINSHQAGRLLSAVQAGAASPSRVGILGLSYKPDTDVVEESAGVHLAEALAGEGYQVVVYDPMGQSAALAELTRRGAKVESAASAEECIRSADVLVFSVAWPEFTELEPGWLADRSPRPVLIDPWRLFSREDLASVADVVHPGRGAADADPQESDGS